MELREIRAIEFTSSQLANALNRCFEGYFVQFALDDAMFERRFRPEGLDMQASILLLDGEQVVAICLVARQGWTSRIAAMGIATDYRSKGLGKRLMMRAIQEAKDRGDRRMVLEVIEENAPGIALYESVGMRKTRRLVGNRREPSEGVPTDLVPIDPSEYVRRMTYECETGLPWDYKPETLALKPNTQAFSLHSEAFALLSDLPERVILWSFFVNQNSRRKGYWRRLIEGLAARFSEKPLSMPVALPDDHESEFLAKLGFVPPSISQHEMAIDLV